MEFIAFKYLHLLAVLILFACIVLEGGLVAIIKTREQLKKLVIVDGIYGMSSIVVLLSGFYIALSIGKGQEFYFDNPALYIKLGLFIVVGLLSIYPTIFFIKESRKKDAQNIIEFPTLISHIIKLEIFLIASIPIFGVVLANGYSIF